MTPNQRDNAVNVFAAGCLFALLCLLIYLAGCAAAPIELQPGQRYTVPPNDKADREMRRDMGVWKCQRCGEWWPNEFSQCMGCE